MKMFLLACLFLSCPFGVWGKTAYVDMAKAFELSRQGRKIKARLEKNTKETAKGLKSAELKIQQEEEALKKEAPLLSEQARAQKIQQLQQKILNFQKEVKKKDLELSRLQNSLMGPLAEKFKQVIGDLAKKEGFSVVENRNEDVLWVSPELDLTQKAVQSFNKKHK